MSDKKLIKKRFEKSLKTYADSAIVQKDMALKLTQLIPGNHYANVLEIGAGTGFLTECINEKLVIENYWVNDLSPKVEDFIKNELWHNEKGIVNKNLLIGDAEKIEFPGNLDLVASGATFQWIKDLEKLLNKIHAKMRVGHNGILAFSTFLDGNFTEFKDTLGISLDYLNETKLKSICEKNFEILYFEQELVTVEFDDIKQLLRHIKLTGANALTEHKWAKSTLMQFENDYKNRYEKMVLTYNPAFMILTPRIINNF